MLLTALSAIAAPSDSTLQNLCTFLIRIKGQLQGHTAMLAAIRITHQSCLTRSPPFPPLASTPFKICAHFCKGASARGSEGGEHGNQL